MRTILVTGGCGYIGSHFITALDSNDFKVIVIDNLSNSTESTIVNINKISPIPIFFYKADLRDKKKLLKIFEKHSIDTVAHFAGLKSVSNSINEPLMYYENNVFGSINLMQCMLQYNVNKLIFSSSATVYAQENEQPVNEHQKLSPVNPYGKTKLIIENLITDLIKTNKNFGAIILRYFNPIGAHPSGYLYESTKGKPNNIMPIIINVAAGIIDNLEVYGDDYNTPDGSGLRDYIHIMDLVKAHVMAIKEFSKFTGVKFFNIGTGNPTSVFDLIKIFEKVNNIKINYKVTKRREGDLPVCFADPSIAFREMNWKSTYSIDHACAHAWNAFINKRK